MKSGLLNSYILQNLKSVEFQLNAYIRDKKPERLHRLRVHLKKIKALNSFLHKVCTVNYNTSRLKPLFIDAGNIQEMQINIRLLTLLPPSAVNSKLIARLKTKADILITQFIKRSSGYFKRIEAFQTSLLQPEKRLGKKAIIKYFRNAENKADKIIRIKNRKRLHRYRMKIKNMMYVYDFLPENIQSDIHLNAVKVKKQQRKLGEWHDLHVAVNFLARQKFPKSTGAHITKLNEKERKQFNALYTSLTRHGN